MIKNLFLFLFMGELFLFSTNYHLAFSWGQIGHRICGEIAQKHLSEQALKNLKEVTNGKSLAEISTLPDFIKSDPKWDHAKKWHYIDIEDNSKYDDHQNKNQIKVEPQNIFEAIDSISSNWNKAKDKNEKLMNLAFLVHFFGDLHQPLHIGRKSDRGGNTIELNWFGKKTNLHAIWDEELIDFHKLSYTEYVQFLMNNTLLNKLDFSLSKKQWVSEALSLRPLLYSSLELIKDSKWKNNWEYRYVFLTKKVVDEQLYKAGRRLAAHLEELLKK